MAEVEAGRPAVVAEVEEEAGRPVLAVGKPMAEEVAAGRPAAGKTAGQVVVEEVGRPAAVVAEGEVAGKPVGERKLALPAEEVGRPAAVEDPVAGRASSAGKEPERKRAAGQSRRLAVAEEEEEVQAGKRPAEEPERTECKGSAEAACTAVVDCTVVWAELGGRRKPDGLERAEGPGSGLCSTAAAGQGRHCS